MAQNDIPAQEHSFKGAVPVHIPSYEEQLATVESIMTCYDTPLTQAAGYTRDLLKTIIALRGIEQPATKPTEAMCDAARAFILGLDMNIRNFGDMRLHLERGGNPVLPYIKEMAEQGQGNHITKWDVADCIYQYMMTALPKSEPMRHEGAGRIIERAIQAFREKESDKSSPEDCLKAALDEIEPHLARHSDEDWTPIVVIKTTDLNAHVEKRRGCVRVQFAFYDSHDCKRLADVQSAFEQWAKREGYDIAPAVLPAANRTYADRDTQAVFDAWNASAEENSRVLTCSK